MKTDDLVKALETKKVLGACLDVLEYESISFENIGEDEPEAFTKLKQMPNVILTPHIAGYSHEAYLKMAKILLEKLGII